MLSPSCGLMMQELYQAFSNFSGQLKHHICGQESGAGDGVGTKLPKSM